MSQVITIHADGSISQIRPGQGKGFDLRSVGEKVSIRRSSLIEWDETQQAFYIEFIDASKNCAYRTDNKLCVGDASSMGFTYFPGSHVHLEDKEPPYEGLVLFEEYEQAVAAEVQMLEAWRKAGHITE